MTTEEGNKLIALFMGIPEPDIHIGSCGEGLWARNLHQKGISPHSIEIKYHSSWDWLMPVVEKIESIKADDTKAYADYKVTIFENSCRIGRLHSQPIIEHFGFTKIQSVWLAVVDFSKLHNPTKLQLAENQNVTQP